MRRRLGGGVTVMTRVLGNALRLKETQNWTQFLLGVPKPSKCDAHQKTQASHIARLVNTGGGTRTHTRCLASADFESECGISQDDSGKEVMESGKASGALGGARKCKLDPKLSEMLDIWIYLTPKSRDAILTVMRRLLW